MDASYKNRSVDQVTMGTVFSTKLKPSGKSNLVIMTDITG